MALFPIGNYPIERLRWVAVGFEGFWMVSAGFEGDRGFRWVARGFGNAIFGRRYLSFGRVEHRARRVSATCEVARKAIADLFSSARKLFSAMRVFFQELIG